MSACQCQCGLYGCASRPGRTPARAGVTVHGTDKGYAAGCECAACMDAHSRVTTAQMKRINEASRPSAVKHGNHWTSAELEIAVRSNLTKQEAAAQLGRTVKAVENARRRSRRDPKYIELLGAGVVRNQR